MPVHNGAGYLGDAIRSILAQTHKDFELLIIDDGSTDGSVGVINEFSDPRIRLERNPVNLGLIATLNRGLELARGEFIARMDADDISLPERLACQLELMRTRPQLGVCGTYYEQFGARRAAVIDLPTSHREIRESLLHTGCTLGHPTVMIRREVLVRTGLRYDPEFAHAEDYRLWSELIWCTEFANLPKILLRYRIHPSQVSRVHHVLQGINTTRVKAGLLTRLLLTVTREQRDLLELVVRWTPRTGAEPMRQTMELLNLLASANAHRDTYEPRGLNALLSRLCFSACLRNAARGQCVVWAFLSARFVSPWRRQQLSDLLQLQRAVLAHQFRQFRGRFRSP